MSESSTQFCESISSCDISLCQYGVFVNEANTPPLPFLNEKTVVALVTAGAGSIKLGNTRHAIQPGAVIAMFPQQCIDCTPLGEQPLSAMWAELDGPAVADSLLRAGLSAHKPVLMPSGGENSRTAAIFTELTDPNAELTVLRACGLTLTLLDQLTTDSPRQTQLRTDNLQQYYVDKSILFIKAKYPQDISVEDVAAYCGLNRSYLGKLFRDATGMTTQEYLIRHRMSIACSYLENAAAPIATIARSVGYPNQLHFSRAFHKVFGIPPREWQKQNRKV